MHGRLQCFVMIKSFRMSLELLSTDIIAVPGRTFIRTNERHEARHAVNERASSSNYIYIASSPLDARSAFGTWLIWLWSRWSRFWRPQSLGCTLLGTRYEGTSVPPSVSQFEPRVGYIHREGDLLGLAVSLFVLHLLGDDSIGASLFLLGSTTNR